MSEDNTSEATPVEETNAATGKAPKEKKEKAEKAPKPQERYWCGNKAAREGAVYNRLQVLVAKNPGLTRDEMISKLQAEGFAAKNSKKFEENPTQFIGGYLTAGARKGFFTTEEGSAVDAPQTVTVEKKEKAEKGPTVSESGRAALDALKEALGDRFGAGEGIPVTDLAEKLGKTKTQLSRTLDKLTKDGMIEIDTIQDGEESVDYAYVQQKGVDLLSAPAAA